MRKTFLVGPLNSNFSSTVRESSWQKCFVFFYQYGPLSSSIASEAYKGLLWQEKWQIKINLMGLFGGPIYFLILGLWKKVIAITDLTLAAGFIMGIMIGGFGNEIPPFIFGVICIAANLVYAISANYAYFQKTVHHRQSWNTFEGWWVG